jgi:hypothetical protein
MIMRAPPLILLVLSGILVGCRADPNQAANEIYVNTVQQLREIRSAPDGYSEALSALNEVVANLDYLQENYPQSDLAADIASGNKKFLGADLESIYKLHKLLSYRDRARSSPLYAAIFLAYLEDEPQHRARDLIYIARRDSADLIENVRDALLADALQAINEIESAEDRIYQLQSLAYAHMEFGELGLGETYVVRSLRLASVLTGTTDDQVVRIALGDASWILTEFQLQNASDVLEQISTLVERALEGEAEINVLIQLAKAHLNNSMVENAQSSLRRAFRKSSERKYRSIRQARVIEAAAEMGLFDTALDLARSTDSSPDLADSNFSALIKGMVSSQYTQEALLLLDEIEDVLNRAETVLDGCIIAVSVDRATAQYCNDLVSAAVEIAKSETKTDFHEIRLLTSASIYYAYTDNKEVRSELLARSEHIAKGNESYGSSYYAPLFAEALAKVGEMGGALDYISESKEDYRSQSALETILSGSIDQSGTTAEPELLQRIETLMPISKFDWENDRYYSLLALAYARNGKFTDSNRMLGLIEASERADSARYSIVEEATKQSHFEVALSHIERMKHPQSGFCAMSDGLRKREVMKLPDAQAKLEELLNQRIPIAVFWDKRFPAH